MVDVVAGQILFSTGAEFNDVFSTNIKYVIAKINIKKNVLYNDTP